MPQSDPPAIPATAVSKANVFVAVYEQFFLERAYPKWESYSSTEKLARINDPNPKIGQTVTPLVTSESENTTTIGLDRYRVANLDGSQTDNEFCAQMAVGVGTEDPDYEDESLTAELGRTRIDSYDARQTRLFCSAFLDSEEANEGSDPLTEVGVISSTGRLFNHSLISPISKTAARTITVDVVFSFDTLRSDTETGGS